ncbi:hypothetical protein GA0115253_105851, partial [Streptomyces sp. Termitarium-T10T-6]
MPAPVASALWAKAACSEIRTAWLRFGLPSSAPDVLRARVSSTCASPSDIRSASTFAVWATRVSLSPPCRADEAPMPASASSPVALRAGSAAPMRTRSEPSAPATNSAQVYVLRGQHLHREAAAVGLHLVRAGLSARERTDGAMSGDATTDRCTAESSQDSEN